MDIIGLGAMGYVVLFVVLGGGALKLIVSLIHRHNRVVEAARRQCEYEQMSEVQRMLKRYGQGPFFPNDNFLLGRVGDTEVKTLLKDIELRSYKIHNRYAHIHQGLCDYTQVDREFDDVLKDAHERMGLVDQLIEQFFPEFAEKGVNSQSLAREGWGIVTSMAPFLFRFHRL